MSRDDFLRVTVETLAKRVGNRCSRPDCRKLTTGPHSAPTKTVNIGVAAHITAASEGGPRYDRILSSEERQSIANGIWLCQDCAKLIDSDESRFPVDLLRRWKTQTEEAAQSEIEGRTSPSHTVKEELDRILETQEVMLDKQAQQPESIKACFAANLEAIQQNINSLSTTIFSALLAPQNDANLKYARQLIEENKPAQALAYLETQKAVTWPHASETFKAQFLNCMGAANLRLMREREAANLFFAAQRHDDQDEKILCNCAVGHFLLGDHAAAIEAVKRILDRNPANMRARSVMIHASVGKSFDDILRSIPPSCYESHDVALALGSAAQERQNPDEAVKWFRIALDKEEIPSADTKASLATAILASMFQKDSTLLNIDHASTDQVKALREVVSFLDNALELLQESEIRRTRYSYLVNRGVAKKVLGDKVGAAVDIDEALRYEPDLPVALFHRAIIADSLGERDRAIRLLGAITDTREVPFAPLLKADFILERDGADAALAEITSFLDTSPPDNLVHTAKRLLVSAYLAKEDVPAARRLSDEVLETNPTDVIDLVEAACVRKREGLTDEGNALLANAKRYVTTSTRLTHIAVLADAFYQSGQFTDAASVYDKIADIAVDCPITRRFLLSCYRAGRMDRALEITERLRLANGPLQFAAEMETAIYEEIGDLPKAEQRCLEYLTAFPHDDVMKVRLAAIHLRGDQIDKVDDFLTNPPDWRDMPAQCAIQIANLFAVRNRDREAIQLMYEVRRKHLDDGAVHLRYIQSLFLGGHSEKKWLNTDTIGDGTAVCIEDISGNRFWYVLDDREDADIGRNELRLAHPLTQRLLGKKTRDKVLLKEEPVASEGTIIEVKSKYVHALHESAGILEVNFPDVKGFVVFRFPKGEEGSRVAAESILDHVSKSHDARQLALSFYLEGKTTLGHLSNLIGVNIVDAWAALTCDPRFSVRCCLGSDEERANALAALSEGTPQLVADVVSLLTLHRIGAADEIVKMFGRLGVAQTTIDGLNDILHKRRLVNPDGYGTIFKEGDRFVRQTVTAEHVQESIQELSDLMAWIRQHCDILPVTEALRMEKSYVRERGRLLGEENVDTVLIAKEPNRLLLSDDFLLRGIALTELGVRGVWTQAVLLHAIQEPRSSRSTFNSATLSLVGLGYRHVTVDAGVLLHAASEAQWLPEGPFESVVQRLRHDESSDISAVAVAVDFLYELSQQPITTFRQDALLFGMLDVLVSGRRMVRTLNLLADGVRQRFRLTPFAADDYLGAIYAWQSRRLV